VPRGYPSSGLTREGAVLESGALQNRRIGWWGNERRLTWDGLTTAKSSGKEQRLSLGDQLKDWVTRGRCLRPSVFIQRRTDHGSASSARFVYCAASVTQRF